MQKLPESSLFSKTADDEGQEVTGSLAAAKSISIYSAEAAAILSHGVTKRH